MPRSSTARHSPEVRPPDNRELLETLLTMPGSTYGAYSRFHPYSPRNRAWLFMQGVDPQPIATFQGWKKIGRHVIRGRQARYVSRPVPVKLQEVDPTTGEQKERTFTRFVPSKSVFPLEDTDGEPLPPIETPEWTLECALANLAIRLVQFESFDGNTAGYSYERTIAINPLAPNRLKTACHEIGHILLGHTTADAFEEYRQHRGVKEAQAEAVAYLTLNELDAMDDITASRSRAYCQGWLSGERPSELAISQVFAAHEVIFKAGRLAVEGENQ